MTVTGNNMAVQVPTFELPTWTDECFYTVNNNNNEVDVNADDQSDLYKELSDLSELITFQQKKESVAPLPPPPAVLPPANSEVNNVPISTSDSNCTSKSDETCFVSPPPLPPPANPKFNVPISTSSGNHQYKPYFHKDSRRSDHSERPQRGYCQVQPKKPYSRPSRCYQQQQLDNQDLYTDAKDYTRSTSKYLLHQWRCMLNRHVYHHYSKQKITFENFCQRFLETHPWESRANVARCALPLMMVFSDKWNYETAHPLGQQMAEFFLRYFT